MSRRSNRKSGAAPSARSLTARSVLLSVLLGTEPPRLPVRLLVRTTELFGIAEGTTRTALSRMRDTGEVVADDGWYALRAPRLLARQARQSVSRAAQTQRWESQRWLLAVVAASGPRAAADRAAVREALQAARLAELREGVWMRPDNLGGAPEIEEQDGGSDLSWFVATPEDEPGQLAERLWDLPAWAAQANQLRKRMAELVGPLQEHDRTVLADGFVLSADVLRHFQADPLLPPELLPPDWPGEALRDDYDRYDTAYRAVLRLWFAENR